MGIGVYLLTSLFYVFASGTPQPADYLLLMAIAATLLFAWNEIPSEPPLYFASFLFLAWVVLVNSFWFLMIGDWVFVRKTSFYVYNMIVLWFVVAAGARDFSRLKSVIASVCLLTLFIQVLVLVFWPDASKRSIGTFNNPNQLGYWALLAMACLAVARERVRLGFLDIAGLAAGVYITMLSLSKAATISALLLIVIIVATCRWRQNAGWMLAAVLLVGGVVELTTGAIVERVSELRPVALLTDDLAGIADNGSEDVAKRGYRRLVHYPNYLALGAGEGAFYRLDPERSVDDPKEFHSTIGNILMSYGLVGLVLFAVLLITIAGRASWASIGYLTTIMLYSITHMGLRFSLFWVFLGFIYAQAQESRRLQMHPPTVD